MTNSVIYLDNAATTQPSPEVCKVVCTVMREHYGNPSSLHGKGLEAERIIYDARSQVARVLGVGTDSIFFTAGGTEANNIAIFGVCRVSVREFAYSENVAGRDDNAHNGKVGRESAHDGKVGRESAYRGRARRIVTSAMEHPSVLNPLKALEGRGWDVTYISGSGGSGGVVDMEALDNSLDMNVALISLAHVNNETGAILPLDEVRSLRDRKCPGALLHLDCAQSFAKLPISPERLGADIISISAHKIHGPKGAGALYISERARRRIQPLIYGGGQENGVRSGTENTPAIAGFGAAAREAAEQMGAGAEHVRNLKHRLIEAITQTGVAFTRIPGGDDGSPYILTLAFPGIPAELMLNHLDREGVYVSSGAACSSRRAAKTGSHVLAAMGLKDDIIKSAIRFSFSRYNTIAEIEAAAERLKRAVSYIRA